MTHPEDPYRSGTPEQPPTWQTTGSQAPGYQAPGYGPPPQGYGQVPVPAEYALPRETSTRAVVALVLASSSFLVFPLIPAIVALVLVPGAREEIDLSGGRVTGDGLLLATKIVAWINIGLCIAGVLFFVAFVALFASTGFS